MVAAFKTLAPRSKQVISTRILLQRRTLAQRLAIELRRFFQAQSRRVLIRMAVDEAFTKAKRKADELLPVDEDKLLSAIMRPFIEQGIISATELATMMIGVTTPSNTLLMIEDFLGKFSSQRIVGINETTRNAVQEALVRAANSGYSQYQTAHGVPEDGFRGIGAIVQETYRGRAEAIARTEMGQASQAASIAQWRELGVGFQEIQDGDGDDACAERNGTIVSIDVDVDLLHPNCTVVSLPVVDGNANVTQPESDDEETGHAEHPETTALAREAAGQ